MTNNNNFISLSSFDFLFDFLSNFNLYNYDIVSVLPVLILCLTITTVFVSFISYSSRLGEKIIKNAGTIGTGIVIGLTGLESALNLVDRFKGSGNSGNSGGSDDNSDKKDKKDEKNKNKNEDSNDNNKNKS
jgi:hypothetical protein